MESPDNSSHSSPGTAGLSWFLWLLLNWNKVYKQSQPVQGLHRGTSHLAPWNQAPWVFCSVVVIHVTAPEFFHLPSVLPPPRVLPPLLTIPGLLQFTCILSSSSLGSSCGMFGADICHSSSLYYSPSGPSSILTHSALSTQAGQFGLSDSLQNSDPIPDDGNLVIRILLMVSLPKVPCSV